MLLQNSFLILPEKLVSVNINYNRDLNGAGGLFAHLGQNKIGLIWSYRFFVVRHINYVGDMIEEYKDATFNNWVYLL